MLSSSDFIKLGPEESFSLLLIWLSFRLIQTLESCSIELSDMFSVGSFWNSDITA